MPATLSLTETQTLTALHTVLVGILPAGIEVVRGEQNRVAEPLGPDFVIFWPLLRRRLSTNVDSWADSPFGNPRLIGARASLSAMELTVQIDVHGPASADNVQMLSTLLRDEYACLAFARTGFDVQPLYADDPRQQAFENAEQQTEYRWTLDVVLQANPVVSTDQDFADAVAVGVIEIDASYPP